MNGKNGGKRKETEFFRRHDVRLGGKNLIWKILCQFKGMERSKMKKIVSYSSLLFIGFLLGFLVAFVFLWIYPPKKQISYDRLLKLSSPLSFPFQGESVKYRHEIKLEETSNIVIARGKDTGGVRLYITCYKNGVKNGLSIVQNNMFVCEQLYDNGEIVRERYLDNLGRILADGQYVDSERHNGSFLVFIGGLSGYGDTYQMEYKNGSLVYKRNLTDIFECLSRNIYTFYQYYYLSPES